MAATGMSNGAEPGRAPSKGSGCRRDDLFDLEALDVERQLRVGGDAGH